MISNAALSRKRILVTGGGGFIGSNLVRSLISADVEVVVIDNFSNGLRSNLTGIDGVVVHEGDIRDLDSVKQAVAGCDLVYHLAALGSVPRSLEAPSPSYAVNLVGSVNVFDAARLAGVNRVVYASSSSVYGNTDAKYKTEGQEGDPISPYAASKAAMELAARTHSKCYEMDIRGLRFFNVFGPWQRPDAAYAAVVPRFTEALLSGRRPVIFGDGAQTRDFTYVDDVVKALVLAGLALEGGNGEALNISSGVATTVLSLFDGLVAATGVTPVEPAFENPRPGDILVSRADVGRAQVELGFQADWSVREGLKQYVDWYGTRSGSAGEPSLPSA